MSWKNTIISDIENYTSRGHYYLQQGQKVLQCVEVSGTLWKRWSSQRQRASCYGLLEHAKNAYEVAFTECRKLKSTLAERCCAFNLGASFIALQEAEKGLQWLQKAVPPVNERDGGSNGDIFFNLGLAYELLNNTTEALKYYELAYQEYHFQSDDFLMEVTVVRKIALLYKKLKNPLQAVKFYKIAASLFIELENGLQQATCLSQIGAQLVSIGKYDGALEAADSTVALCKRCQPEIALGKLYNELGLIYTQCHNFARAAYCFEQAVSIFQGRNMVGSKAKAVVLQNLGAVYNSLGDYQKALMFHESSASIHASNNNRGLQGQCFTNLGFAYSQLNDIDTAGECYMHAVQAAKDAKDKKGQWQAMEGLGSVCFNQGKTNKAIVYFKLALRILMDTKEYSHKTEERVLGKITDALHHHVKRKETTGLPTSSIQNETVQEAGNVMPVKAYSVSERRYKEPHTVKRSLKKVTREFDGVAHGVGRYSTDDDLSVASSVRTIEQQKVLSSVNPQLSKDEDQTDLEKYKRRQRGLLRTQTHNSELEWQKEVRQPVLQEHTFSDETLQYVEKLHPVSSNDESDSDDTMEETPKELQNREKIKQILKRQDSVKDGTVRKDPTDVSDGPSSGSEAHSPVETQESADVSPAESNELGISDHLLQYQHRIRRKSMHDEASSEILTNYDESEIESSSSETSDDSNRPLSNERPLAPVHSPLQTQQLSNTYEEPLPVEHISSSSEEETGPLGANYFHPDNHKRQSGKDTLIKSGNEMDGSDPLYQTIQSVTRNRNDDDQKEENLEREEGLKSPELPPRPLKLQNLSRAEEEEYLRKYHRDLQQKKVDGEESVSLPKNSNKRSSKSQMCHIM